MYEATRTDTILAVRAVGLFHGDAATCNNPDTIITVNLTVCSIIKWRKVMIVSWIWAFSFSTGNISGGAPVHIRSSSISPVRIDVDTFTKRKTHSVYSNAKWNWIGHHVWTSELYRNLKYHSVGSQVPNVHCAHTQQVSTENMYRKQVPFGIPTWEWFWVWTWCWSDGDNSE